MKIVKKRKSKNHTQDDRNNNRKKSKNKSYHKCKPVKSNIKELYGNFNDQYRLGLFRFLITKDYFVMVTLTHAEKVTLKQHETIVNQVLKNMVDRGYLEFYFKVNEWDYFNYHSHILVQGTEKVRDITRLFKRYWKKYGHADIRKFKNIREKYKATNYCLKQLKPLDRRHSVQELIDTWNYYELPSPVVEFDLFRDDAFLASIRSKWDYTYQRPPGSLIIPNMTLKEAFDRIQAKMDARPSYLPVSHTIYK